MKVDENQLKNFLIDSDLVNKKDLKKIEQEARNNKQDLDQALLAKKLVSETQLAKIYAYILGIPFVSLEKSKIKPKILKIIPEAIARKHRIIAFNKTDQEIEVAMLDPKDLETIEFIVKKSGLRVVPRLTSKESILVALKQYQKELKSELEEITRQLGPGINQSDDQDLEKVAKELPVIKIVDTVLKHGILEGASDIHIEPLEHEVEVRYRLDGLLKKAMSLPKETLTGIVARIKVLSNLKLDEHRLPQDGRFKIESEDYKISFRVSILPLLVGEKVVLRLLPERSEGLTLEILGLETGALEKVHRAINRPHGMILVTGPTGSGKTTTLYTCLDILNKPNVNITTIEDPIEYQIEHVNQTQVQPKIDFDFASGLRSIVRQDPDIIMVGEIRDKETASIAVNSALTGHLLLSTLHTNDAATAFPRLRDLEIEPFLIASTVNLVIAQRLTRRISPDTKTEKYSLDPKELDNLSKTFDLDTILEVLKKQKIVKNKDDWSSIKFTRPLDPSEDSAYRGRIGVYEVMEVTSEIQSLINHEATSHQISETARKEGMITLAQDAFIKAIKGLTSLDEILRVTKE